MTLIQQLLAERAGRSNETGHKNAVAFIGDLLIPQLVDGGYWKTSIFLVNLENHTLNFTVMFFNDNGNDLYVPVTGQGSVRALNITLDAAQSLELVTAGVSANLAQGWAYISGTSNDSVGGMAIIRQSVPGHPSQETVVPIVTQLHHHFVLLFDNTVFTTAVALANSTASAVVIPVSIHNQLGQFIDRRTITLGPYSHKAFTLPDTWSSTASQRGSIQFLISGFGVGALGVRFSGAAFTSFNVLETVSSVSQ